MLYLTRQRKRKCLLRQCAVSELIIRLSKQKNICYRNIFGVIRLISQKERANGIDSAARIVNLYHKMNNIYVKNNDFLIKEVRIMLIYQLTISVILDYNVREIFE